jgi:hypothetical protein
MTVRASLDNGSFDGDDETTVQINAGSNNPKGVQMQPQQMQPASMQMQINEPVKVLLGVVDASMPQIFHNAFAQMPITAELLPAAGADNILHVRGNPQPPSPACPAPACTPWVLLRQLFIASLTSAVTGSRNALLSDPPVAMLGPQVTQQAMSLGIDMILLAPEYLQDRSPTGLLARLRSAGQRVGAGAAA